MSVNPSPVDGMREPTITLEQQIAMKIALWSRIEHVGPPLNECYVRNTDEVAAEILVLFASKLSTKEAVRASLAELRDYAASVWFDEASALDEEREIMARAAEALRSLSSER
jgi:ubiquinone biosynthesis protein UbiJ